MLFQEGMVEVETQLSPTQAFWEPLVTVIDERLEWVDPGIGDLFKHELPSAFIPMVGEINNQNFDVPLPKYNLVPSSNKEATAAGFMETIPEPGTGYGGLLGISGQRLKAKIEENNLTVSPLLVAGGISPNSLFDVLRWLKTNGLEQIPVTFIDMSPLKTLTINRLREAGYWEWSAGVEIITSTIEAFSERSEEQGKYGISVMDIISAYAIPGVYQEEYSSLKDPFEDYSKVLAAMKILAAPDGLSLHRTLAWSVEPALFYRGPAASSNEEIERTIETSSIARYLSPGIMSQLSRWDLAHEINNRFSAIYPVVPCGLTFLLEEESLKPYFPTNPFKEASDNMKGLYEEIYGSEHLEITRIANPSTRMFFQTFLCNMAKAKT